MREVVALGVGVAHALLIILRLQQSVDVDHFPEPVEQHGEDGENDTGRQQIPAALLFRIIVPNEEDQTDLEWDDGQQVAEPIIPVHILIEKERDTVSS